MGKKEEIPTKTSGAKNSKVKKAKKYVASAFISFLQLSFLFARSLIITRKTVCPIFVAVFLTIVDHTHTASPSSSEPHHHLHQKIKSRPRTSSLREGIPAAHIFFCCCCSGSRTEVLHHSLRQLGAVKRRQTVAEGGSRGNGHRSGAHYPTGVPCTGSKVGDGRGGRRGGRW